MLHKEILDFYSEIHTQDINTRSEQNEKFLNIAQRNNEWLHTQHFAQNNGIPLNLLLRLRRKIQHNTLHNTNSSSPPYSPPSSQEKMGNLHLHLTTDQENYQALQTHWH
jgi:hypothetical protein